MVANNRDNRNDYDLVRSLWPALEERDFQREQHSRLANHVTKVISGLCSNYALPEDASKEVISLVIIQQPLTRLEILRLLEDRYSHSASSINNIGILKALETLARLWSMVQVQFGGPQYAINGVLMWAEGETLLAAVKQHFDWRKAVSPAEPSSHIHPEISAAQLVNDLDVQILWTSNLAEHLAWNPRSRVLRVFEHKVWVWNYLSHPEHAAVPADVLGELMCTLNMLFPLYDGPTRSLLEKYGMIESFYGLGYCGKDRSFEWGTYRYWRKELQELNQIFGEPPRGLRQFWKPDRERRNLLSLALFWLSGVMVLVLTIIGSVCGIMSVEYSKEQTRLAALQWEFSVALACADPETAHKFPQYCGD